MYDDSKHIAVKGYVVVNIGGGAAYANKVQWWSHYPIEESFYEVPTGSALTVTDVLVNTDQLTAPQTIAMDDLWPDNIAWERLFELRVTPNSLPQAHFLTGYVIQPGHAVRGYTTVPGPPSTTQAIWLWLAGYMPRPWVFWPWPTKAARTGKPMIGPNIPHPTG
jgi:hypothetical protein